MAKTVRLPKPERDLLLLHIELKWTTPTIWRRFAVPEKHYLGQVASRDPDRDGLERLPSA